MGLRLDVHLRQLEALTCTDLALIENPLELLDIAVDPVYVHGLDLAEYLARLDSSLRGDEEHGDEEVNLFGLAHFLLGFEQHRLVHEVGQVGDGWYRVTVEAKDCDFGKEHGQWSLSFHIFLV